MNTAKIEHAEIPKGKRILVTSDIHGHLTHLKKILEKASFSKEDILIIVGDIVEKGPESLKTLRYIMELWTQGNVMVSMGNVDALRLQMIQEIGPENIQDFYEYFVSLRKWKGTCFFDELTQELGYLCQSPQEILKAKKMS